MLHKTTPRSICRLGANLMRNPDLIDTIIPYVIHPLRSTWKAEQPLWNTRAISYLAERIPPHGRAFEWGSGGSTVWLSARGVDVTSVESEAEWADRVTRRCPSATVRLIPGSDNGTMRSELQLRDHGEHFFDDYVAAIEDYPNESFDLIIIDGICRVECARRAVAKIKLDGLIIVDDTNWDFLSPCLDFFRGWESRRIRGFKRMEADVFETSFFHQPGHVESGAVPS